MYINVSSNKREVPHESLDCLKGVVMRKAQVGCGQALS